MSKKDLSEYLVLYVMFIGTLGAGYLIGARCFGPIISPWGLPVVVVVCSFLSSYLLKLKNDR